MLYRADVIKKFYFLNKIYIWFFFIISDEVQVKVQAAIMASPIFNIETGSQIRNVVRADEVDSKTLTN